jgi:tetratricopeptide (TPR) repeat protein
MASVVLLSAIAGFGRLLLRHAPQEPEATLAALGRTRGVRPGIARLSVPFANATLDSTRGRDSLPASTREQVARLEVLAEGARERRFLHALGVAKLVQGQLNEAIRAFDQAVNSADNPPDTFRLDLAAALLSRAREDDSPFAAGQALDQLERIVGTKSLSEPVRFDYALALGFLGLDDQGAAAWRDYLEIDANTPWAAEARGHLNVLEARASRSRATETLLGRYRSIDASLSTWRATTRARWNHDEMRAQAQAIRSAGGDLQLPDLVDQVQAASAWTLARRQCLERGLQARAAAVQHFDDTNYTESMLELDKAQEAFRCAAVRILDVDLQRAQVAYFSIHSPAALASLVSLEPIARRAHYFRIVGRIHHVLGLDAFRQGRFTDAESHYEAGLAGYSQAGDTDLGGVLESLAAELLSEQGARVAAWRHFRAALAALPAMAAFRRQQTVLATVATACHTAALPAAAMRIGLELVALGRRSHNRVATITGDLALARGAVALSRDAEATAALQEARRLQSEIIEPTLRRQFDGDIGWVEGLAWQRNAPERAIGSLTQALELYHDTSFHSRLAEIYLALARAHKQLGHRQEARQNVEAGLALFEDQRREIREEQLRISRTSELWGLFEELIDLTQNVGIDALAAVERSHARALLDAIAASDRATPLSGDSLFAWLPSGVTAIQFASLPDRLLRFVITNRGLVDVRTIPLSAHQLDVMVHDYVRALSIGAASEQGSALAAQLLPAAWVTRTDGPLVLLPDGPLFDLPFAALPAPGSGRPLVQDAIPIVAASLTTLRLGRRTGPPNPSTTLLIGVAAGRRDEGVPPLPGAAAEIEQLRRLYPEAVALVGARATRAEILRYLPAASVVHFAGHAVADPLVPSRSRLLVADGRAADLTPLTLAGLHLQPGMIAVLAACSTAEGLLVRGEGPMSLARPFLANGASAVIASLWDIGDEQSTSLLVRLHEGLRRGRPAAEALAMAQRDAIRSGAPAHAWAAFESIGGLK